MLEEYAPNGVLAATYVRGFDLLFQDRGGVQSYYAKDGLGSTRALTNSAGVVTDTYTYDAFGNLMGSTGVTTNDFLYAGYQNDGAVGLNYLRARYLDTAAGRFTSRDTYDGRTTNPITLNAYVYTHGDSVNYFDPSGHDELADVLVSISSGLNNFARIGGQVVSAYQRANGILSAIDTISSIIGIATGDLTPIINQIRQEIGSTKSFGRFASLFTPNGIEDAFATMVGNIPMIISSLMANPAKLTQLGTALKGSNPAFVILMPTPPRGNTLAKIPAIRISRTLGSLQMPVFLSFKNQNQTGRFIGFGVSSNYKHKNFDESVTGVFHMDYILHGASKLGTRIGGPGPNNVALWHDGGFEFQIPTQ